MTAPLLAVEGLEKHYPTRRGWLGRPRATVRAVDGVDLTVRRGEAVGVVGESGCGKSTLVRTALGLEAPTGGRVRFDDASVEGLRGEARLRFRRRAQYVPQDVGRGFDPRLTVGESVAEPLEVHGLRDRARRRDIVSDLLERVGLGASVAERYPHEVSSGERRRLAVARALVLDPDLLALDEPTTGLDAPLQNQLLRFLADLRDRFDLSMVFVSHDVRAVRAVCDRVAVMYAGELVEVGPTDRVLSTPDHPYTRVLLDAVPSLDPRDRDEGVPPSGGPPDPMDPPVGCRFHPRCPVVIPPDSYDLDADEFRAVHRFRAALARGDVGAVDGTDRRGTYDLPRDLSDPAADRALSVALDALAAGDVDAARTRLAREFESVCERVHPVRDRTPACHRCVDAPETDDPGGGA